MRQKLLFLILIQFVICNLQSVKADWVQCSNGLTELHIGCLISNGNYLFCGTDFSYTGCGIFISTDNGNNWSISQQLNLQAFGSMDKNNIYVYAVGSTIVFTSNNGSNWGGYTYMPNGGHSYGKVAVNGNNVFVGLIYNSADPGGIYRSTDYGFNWVQTSFPTAQYSNVWSIAINNNYVFASSTMLNTYRSSDNGNTWNQSLNTASIPIEVKGDSVYLFGGPYLPGYFYYSSNNGINWTQYIEPDSLVPYALLIYGNYLFAAGGANGGGFFMSSNNGITWLKRVEGLPYLLFSLCITNNYIFAGTDGYGVFRRPLSELTQIKLLSNNIPKKYLLKQNYPNPFNPFTTIEYEIPKLSNVTLKIYDVLGHDVETLINEKLSAGYYKVEWNASNYPSGTYFCNLMINNELIETKKMIISK